MQSELFVVAVSLIAFIAAVTIFLLSVEAGSQKKNKPTHYHRDVNWLLDLDEQDLYE